MFLFYWLLHRLHDATIYRDTGRKWECTTNVPSFGPDYYMQSQLVGNYSEKLCLSFFPLICYLRQLWHDKRAWKGLEQQINVTDTKHLKLSFSLATSAHNPLNNLPIFYFACFFLVSMNFILIEFRLNLFYSCQFLATHCKFRTHAAMLRLHFSWIIKGILAAATGSGLDGEGLFSFFQTTNFANVRKTWLWLSNFMLGLQQKQFWKMSKYWKVQLPR